jgi:16S rRNA (guanine527-N7)-methyltransferase
LYRKINLERGVGMKAAGKPPSRSPKKETVPPDLDREECRQLLQEGAKILGISLSAPQWSRFMEYLFLLQKWNRVINLTALYTRREIIIKHFLDSLTLMPLLPKTFRLLDLGSGAGFPGLPVKIMDPEQDITLLEASSKKVSFLREVLRSLGLRDVTVIQLFLNKEAPVPLDLRNPFDIITSRAVGRLPDILTVARSCLAKGGKLILMKGKKGGKELIEAAPLIQDLGFQMEEPISLTLPFTDQERSLFVLLKSVN